MTTLGYVASSIAAGLGMYLGVGGWFEIVYYRRRRAEPRAWKCQPDKFPSARSWREQLLIGMANMTAGSIASGFAASWVAGGATAIYFDWRTRGMAFTLVMPILYFLVTDLGLYLAHRAYHTPLLYRAIHRWHHRYPAPNAFTAAAMHPIEFATYQLIAFLPLLVMPVHVVGVIAVLVFQNYVGLVDHSGVKVRPLLPYRPPPDFHDDHHRFFHVNYGQHLGIWDRVFGTYRREDRVYGAEIFGGRGAPKPGAADARPRYVDYGARR